MRKQIFTLLVALLAVGVIPLANGEDALRARGAGGAAPRRAGVSASQEVSRDSLEAMVRFLSVDSASKASRTRYAPREASLGLVADSLAARLERCTGNRVEKLPFAFTADDSTFTGENVVASLKGTGATAGVFLITAHYDAIASRTPGWLGNWQMWPAPGADDNGTGVAALMEAARVLPGHVLPFDVMFVLFSAEELDRLGSKDFVSHYESLYGERIIGVMNCDMLGYSSTGSPAGALVSNYVSGWLSDMIGEAASRLDPSLPLEIVLPGPGNSDHGSFWEASIPAVMFIEPLGEHWTISNWEYHTLGDTMSWINFDQVTRLTSLMVGFLADLAAAPAEIGVFPTDVALFFRGVQTLSRSFEMGDTINVRVRVRNSGAEDAPAGATVRLVLSVENGRGSRSVFSDMLEPPAALDFREVTVPVPLGPDFLGGDKIRAAISVLGMDDIAANNAAEFWIGVAGKGEPVLMHAIQPNPIRKTFGGASFCINLSRAVDIGLELYNLEGEHLGSAYVGSRWGTPLEAGMNCLKLGELFPHIDRLASGIYLYRLVLYENGAARKSLTGRFAIEN